MLHNHFENMKSFYQIKRNLKLGPFKQLQVDFDKYKESGDPRFTTVNLAHCLEALAQ